MGISHLGFIGMNIFIKLIFLAGATFSTTSLDEGSEDRYTSNLIYVKKGQLLAVIPEWGPNFRITFDLTVHSLYSSRSDGWANVLYFTASDYCRTTAAGAFRTNTWCRIEIEQKFEGYQWRYTVKVAGIGTVANVVNTKPGKWNNVAVYASSRFYPSSNAQIRNLNYVSSSAFAALP